MSVAERAMPKRRDKQRVGKFIREYSKDLNGIRAMSTISPELEPNALSVKTSRWLAADEIREKIREELEHFDASIVNKHYVVCNLYKIINDTRTPANTRINALSVLSKCLNLSKDNEFHLTNIIGEGKLTELINKRVPKD